MMGSLEDEPRRETHEGLPRRVVIRKPIAIGKFEVTVDQFAAFVAETRTSAGSLCRVIVGDNGNPRRSFIMGPPESSFREPGFAVGGTHPAVCISWDDAEQYAAWLRGRTGKPYRLPTEAEWEYAARAGTQTIYSFGNETSDLCAYGRFVDPGSPFPWRDGCGGGAAGPTPVGQLMANPWGLFDMHGNAWEWVEDCWTANASEIPTNGSAFLRASGCNMRVMRGGSWANGRSWLRSAVRREMGKWVHYNNIGFRIALSLGE
jgi:formylglycine-generating enzyme required for sulfatase activity